MRSALIAVVVLAGVSADAEVNTSTKARLAAAARVVREAQAAASIPGDYWNKARCVAVFPELKNEKFVVGGKYSTGVMSCRIGDGWSAPAFIELGKGTRMFQLGAQQMDLVLLVMNEAALQRLAHHAVTLGADASIAPGPIDPQLRVDPAAESADILTYSRAKGLSMSIAGGSLRDDGDANVTVYGNGSSLRTILASSGVTAPTEARAFVAALANQPATMNGR